MLQGAEDSRIRKLRLLPSLHETFSLPTPDLQSHCCHCLYNIFSLPLLLLPNPTTDSTMAGTQLPYSRTVLTRHQALTTANLAKLNAINDRLAKPKAEQVTASVSAGAHTAASDNTTNTTPPAAPRARPTAREDPYAANLRRWLALPSGKPLDIILAF